MISERDSCADSKGRSREGSRAHGPGQTGEAAVGRPRLPDLASKPAAWLSRASSGGNNQTGTAVPKACLCLGTLPLAYDSSPARANIADCRLPIAY